jgi:O-antigen/teichoic acid export membrane protein
VLLGLFFFNDNLLSSLTQFDLNFIEVNSGSLIFIMLMLVRIPNQFVMLFYVRLYEPIGDIHKSLKYQMLNVGIEVFFTLLILVLTRNLLYVSIGLVIVVNLFNIVIISKITKELNLNLKISLIKISDFFITIKNSFLLSIGFVIEKIYENGLNAVVSKAYLPEFVPLFGTGRVLSNSALKFSNVASEPLMPNIQKSFALNDVKSINNFFFKYWRITSNFSIVFIVVLIPFLEKLFNIWTKNKLEFNLILIVSLLASMLLQNYSMILNQFIRRTNNSKLLIYYNLIKVSLTLLCLFLFGKNLFVWGLGVSLLIGEFISCIFLVLSFKKSLFIGNIKEVFTFFLLLTIMSIILIIYSFNQNFLLLVLSALLIIFLMNFKFIKKKYNDYL